MQPLLYEDLAVTLKVIPFEDRHQMITALTQNHGMISAVARNSIQSRRFGGTLQIFAASLWTFRKKENHEVCFLQEATIKRSFEGIRKNFESLSLASALNEILLRLSPQDESSKDLFKLHCNALSFIEQNPTHSSEELLQILSSYLAKVLQWSGNQPLLQECFTCAKSLDALDPSDELICLISDAAWICPECRTNQTRHLQNLKNKLILPKKALFFLNFLLRSPISGSTSNPLGLNLNFKELQDLYQYLEALLTFHIPGFDRNPIQSLRFLSFLNLKSNLLPLPMSPQ